MVLSLMAIKSLALTTHGLVHSRKVLNPFIKNRLLKKIFCCNLHLQLSLVSWWYRFCFEGNFFLRFWRRALYRIYYRSGTCFNHPRHWTWIQYQAANPKLRSYYTPFKLACCLPQKQLQNHESSIKWPSPSIMDPLQSTPRIFLESSLHL